MFNIATEDRVKLKESKTLIGIMRVFIVTFGRADELQYRCSDEMRFICKKSNSKYFC